ncbi:major facilitator superfamily domain-containing protein rtet [Arctopsyche grandis]|uniref:major facilitator superfamily domain-containing protein rtet n=1 Tax=Arctopsyche grandis TaxID=121162 RepID=UPI00406D7A23
MVRTRLTNYSPIVADDNEVVQRKTSLRDSMSSNKVSDSSKTIKRHKSDENQNVKNGHAKSQKPNGKKQDQTSDEKTHPTVYLVFFSLLLDLLAFTMILPLLPSLLDHYRQYDSVGLYKWVSDHVRYFQELVGAPERFNSVLFGGVLGSMYSFLQFVVSPIAGGLSDVYGRKPLMILSLLGISFSYLLWAVSHNFAIFVVARFVGGLSKGNVSLTMAIISDVSSHKNRGKAMALVGIAFSLGFILGPVIGALFSLWSDKTSQNWFIYPALCALVLSLADLLFIAVLFKETLPKEKRAPGLALSLSRALSFISINDLFNFKAVQKITLKELSQLKRLGQVYFIYLFLYSGLEFTLTFLTHHVFEYTSMQQGKMFFVIGIIMAILQGGVVRRLPANSILGGAQFGLWIIPLSFISVACASKRDMLLFGTINAIHFLYAGLVLFAVSTAFVVSCLTASVSQIGGADQRGTILGVFRSLGALARALGPVVASIAYWSIGAFSTYSIGGVCLLMPVLLLRSSKNLK